MPEQFIEIEVEPRPTTGKKSRRDAAEKGLIPGVVYGGGKDPVPIAVDPKTNHSDPPVGEGAELHSAVLSQGDEGPETRHGQGFPGQSGE